MKRRLKFVEKVSLPVMVAETFDNVFVWINSMVVIFDKQENGR